jgi:hypothetical protein
MREFGGSVVLKVVLFVVLKAANYLKVVAIRNRMNVAVEGQSF